MEQKIIQIDEKTWRIEDAGVRFFVLEGENYAALIDTGMRSPDAKEIAESLTSKQLLLMNTHSDIDHISGNNAFNMVCIAKDEEALYKERVFKEQQIIELVEGDYISLGGRTLTVVNLAGHTPGSIGFIDSRTHALISGDPIQKGGQIFMFGPARSIPLCIESLKKLQEKTGWFDEIWPSHAQFPIGKEMIPELITDLENIVNGDYAGKEIEMHGHKVFAAEGTSNTILIDPKN